VADHLDPATGQVGLNQLFVGEVAESERAMILDKMGLSSC
jgi:hypothetical protein